MLAHINLGNRVSHEVGKIVTERLDAVVLRTDECDVEEHCTVFTLTGNARDLEMAAERVRKLGGLIA